MPFWTDSALEPKRQHRWILFIKSENDLPSYVIKKVDKPTVTINETEHKFFGHSFWYPGHVTWETIDVTLVDPINPDAADKVMNAIQSAGYAIPRDRDSRTHMPATISKAKAQGWFGGLIKLQQLDPANKVIETWRLYNPWIKSAKWGTLDYSSDEMVEITLTLRYDYAQYTSGS